MRRSKAQLIHDMLAAVEKQGHIKPTHLVYKANLSYNVMIKYVEDLIQAGFLEEQNVPEGKRYTLTDTGRDYLAEYRKFKEFSDAFGLS